MPATYDVLSTYTVVEFHPPDKQVKMLEWIAVAKPSGVQFYFRLPNDQNFAAGLKAASLQLAQVMNAHAAVDGVSGIVVNQNLDQNNQVDYTVDTTVVSDDGLREQTFTMKWNDFYDQPTFEAHVAKVLAQLNELAPE